MPHLGEDDVTIHLCCLVGYPHHTSQEALFYSGTKYRGTWQTCSISAHAWNLTHAQTCRRSSRSQISGRTCGVFAHVRTGVSRWQHGKRCKKSFGSKQNSIGLHVVFFNSQDRDNCWSLSLPKTKKIKNHHKGQYLPSVGCVPCAVLSSFRQNLPPLMPPRPYNLMVEQGLIELWG